MTIISRDKPLEFRINGELWKVVEEKTDDDQKYWQANTKDRIVVAHNYDIKQAIYSAQVTYKR